MKKQLVRAAATSVLGLSLMTGFAAADINTTGPGSYNSHKTHLTNRTTVRNDNRVDVSNSNHQSATTGNARVTGNTEGGDAFSGYATNDNSTSASVDIDNSSSSSAALSGNNYGGGGSWGGGGDIHLTGPNSRNTIEFNSSNTVDVRNNNDIDIRNTNTQTARSGDATVSGNTIGGSAVSGDASNTNSSSFDVSVSN